MEIRYENILEIHLQHRCSLILSKTGIIASLVIAFCPAKPLKKENTLPPIPSVAVLLRLLREYITPNEETTSHISNRTLFNLVKLR